MYTTANLTDSELKDEGNRLFSARKFEDAVSCYTKAIVSFLSILHCISKLGIVPVSYLEEKLND